MNKRMTSFLLAATMLLSVAPVGTVRAETIMSTESTTAPNTQSMTASTTAPTTAPTTYPSTLAIDPTAPTVAIAMAGSTSESTNSWMGTVKADPWVRVRGGPGVTYGVITYVLNGARVEVFEITTVNGTQWGRVEKGWICLDYVIFDENNSGDITVQPTTPTTKPVDPSAMTTSDLCIEVLKEAEGFNRIPYWDFVQYTVGYGTTCPSDMVEYYTRYGITYDEAEVLLRNTLVSIERDIQKRIIDKYNLKLTQNQFDALVMFSFNCGTGWCYETDGTFHTAIATGATGNDLIRAFALWCSAGGEIRHFLLQRRLSEANMYLNGIYERYPPDNYCYVLYDANGGTTSPRSQGYNCEWTATPYPVPTREGYAFTGWYTAKVGGTRVTVLDSSLNGTTLYAQWKDNQGNTPPITNTTPNGAITVTVTGSGVNLRQGPGTNYTIVGQAGKGDKLTITETAYGSNYLWGKFNGGWIALMYTDYDTVSATTPTTAPTTAPTTVPTTAPTTVPTVPPVSSTVIIGVTNVDEWLRVRSGPGTSYGIVTYLDNDIEVEILEIKTVGATQWGRIESGWVSMDYIILVENTAQEKENWVVTVTASELLVRSGPGTNFTIVNYLTNGATVTITERKSVGSVEWGKMDKGWICLDYVVFESNDGGFGGSSDDTVWLGTVKTDYYARVHAGPGTTYGVLTYYLNGDRVKVFDFITVDGTLWGRTNLGWICMDNVVIDSGMPAIPTTPPATTPATTPTTAPTTAPTTPPTTAPTTPPTTPETWTGTICAESWVRLREGPGTSYAVLGRLEVGVRVTVTERRMAEGIEWGKVDGGWVSLQYVTLDEDVANGELPEQRVFRTIIADVLNVRQSHGTAYKIVGYVYYGARVEIFETARDSAGNLWGRIATGWISMDYTE